METEKILIYENNSMYIYSSSLEQVKLNRVVWEIEKRLADFKMPIKHVGFWESIKDKFAGSKPKPKDPKFQVVIFDGMLMIFIIVESGTEITGEIREEFYRFMKEDITYINIDDGTVLIWV